MLRDWNLAALFDMGWGPRVATAAMIPLSVFRLCVGALVASLILFAQPALASAHPHGSRTVTRTAFTLVDLAVDQDDPFDDAYAKVRIVSGVNGNGDEFTKVRVKVSGIDADKGTTFGSHVHVGPCVEGDGAAAGPHFNITVSRGDDEVISDETEVWLDMTVGKRGKARSRAYVDFLIPDGEAQSIVIHEMPTDPDGGAGSRLACISI